MDAMGCPKKMICNIFFDDSGNMMGICWWILFLFVFLNLIQQSHRLMMLMPRLA